MKVPYYTTENDAEYCGHVWKQREYIGGRWGFAWAVYPPYEVGQALEASGWRLTQEEAEKAMNKALAKAKGEE
jgi:hypothetical protein